ncbi:MAG: hypothetical protein U9R06_00770 [Patescibacteria group bacterium]|nr:hypothetical protein [Patescibacteria group bacterium]
MKIIKQKKAIVIILIVGMIAIYGFAPPAKNAGAIDSIADAKDLITDSDPGQTATHTFTFTTAATTSIGNYWDIDFSAGNFTSIATGSLACAYGAAGLTEQVIGTSSARCLATAEILATSTQVTLTGVINPSSEADIPITIRHYDSSDQVLERVTVYVTIIEDILMTATVDSSMAFNIFGTSTAGAVGGIPCANVSTATNTPFGTLTVGATSTVCQTLTVVTNAQDGYTVTVEQDHELLSGSGADINSFKDSITGTGSSTSVQAWTSPLNALDAYHTYGHMGLYSDDTDLDTLSGGLNFDNGGGNTYFAGLNSTDPLLVLAHNGPTSDTQDSGRANVIYQVEIGSLQEAGDYESTLTYICTPTF